VVSVTDGFDLNGPAAEIVLAVLSWAAKMERLVINERIAAARERVEAEGRRTGAGLAGWMLGGWRWPSTCGGRVGASPWGADPSDGW
jgi:hypothetical protein